MNDRFTVESFAPGGPGSSMKFYFLKRNYENIATFDDEAAANLAADALNYYQGGLPPVVPSGSAGDVIVV